MSQSIPRQIRLPTNKVFISLLYRLTILISLAPKNNILTVKNTIKIRNPIMLYLTDISHVPTHVWLINTDTKKLTTIVAINTRTKFFKGNFSKNSLKFLCFQKYRPKNPSNPMMIISFRIQITFQIVESKPSLYVIKVWRKNWSKSQIKNIFATSVRTLISLFSFITNNETIKKVFAKC